MNTHECPDCAGSTKVIDSRDRDKGWFRRRQCDCCGKRFNTIEIFEEDLPTETKPEETKRLEALIASVSGTLLEGIGYNLELPE